MKKVKLEINKITFDTETKERFTESFTFRNKELIQELWELITSRQVYTRDHFEEEE